MRQDFTGVALVDGAGLHAVRAVPARDGGWAVKGPLSVSDLLRAYPAITRAQVLADIREGKLKPSKSNGRFSFTAEAVDRWAEERLVRVYLPDRPCAPSLVLHGHDAVLLTLLFLDGREGYQPTTNRLIRRRFQVAHLRFCGIAILTSDPGMRQERHYLRTRINWDPPADKPEHVSYASALDTYAAEQHLESPGKLERRHLRLVATSSADER